MSRFIVFFSVILVVSACATSPLGRKRVLLFGDSTMDSMGVQSFEEIKKKIPEESDPRINAYVKCIARPLIENAGSRIPGSGQEETPVGQFGSGNSVRSAASLQQITGVRSGPDRTPAHGPIRVRSETECRIVEKHEVRYREWWTGMAFHPSIDRFTDPGPGVRGNESGR